MRYKLKLYLYPTHQEEDPKLHSSYELNANALPAFRDLAKSENCFLAHIDENGTEEIFQVSTASEEMNMHLRWLFFLKYFLRELTEKEKLDWLQQRLLRRAKKKINCPAKHHVNPATPVAMIIPLVAA